MSLKEPVPAADRTADQVPAGRSWGELAMCGLVVAIGLALLLGAGSIAIPGSSNTVGPRFFPYLVGAALVAVGVALGTMVWRGKRAPPEAGEDVDANAGTSWLSIAVIAVAFVAHALLINVIGWPLAVTLMFALVAKALGARGWWQPLAAGGITSVVVWLIFVKLLNVALPGGVLLELVTGG